MTVCCQDRPALLLSWVQVESARVVRELRPNLNPLAELACGGVMVTAAGDEAKVDFVRGSLRSGSEFRKIR